MVRAQNVELQCECGSVAGRLEGFDPARADYVVCHCSDCQAFARTLDAEARILDRANGTHLLQTRCATLEIDRGRDLLACLHLTEKPTLRWYASCCDTPMFNTYRNGRVPYITTLLANCDPEGREALTRQCLGHLFLDDAGVSTADLTACSPAKLALRVVPRMIRDLVGGDRRRTALFDPQTLEPIAQPQRLAET